MVADSRGLSEIRKRPGIKGKRIGEVRLTVKEMDDVTIQDQ